MFMHLWKIESCKNAYTMQKYSVYNNHRNI